MFFATKPFTSSTRIATLTKRSLSFRPTLLQEGSINKENKGIIQSFLRGKQQDIEDEKNTYSKLLARGKYIHEIQKHRVIPSRVHEYSSIISQYYPKLLEKFSPTVKLCGSWMTQIGEQDSAVHIWEFSGYPGHKEVYNQLKQDKEFQEFDKALRSTLVERNNQICLEFAFWYTSPPKFNGGIYELRSYLLKPGKLLEWETNWRRGLECRRKYCEPVGAWFSQLGHLNYVHHMWTYPDLEDRKLTREQAWKEAGWAETVYNTVPLVESMDAQIMTPFDFSPLK